MTYRERLDYWAVVRLLPTHHWLVIARFHRRADADGYCRFMKQSMPSSKFQVVFDLPTNQ